MVRKTSALQNVDRVARLHLLAALIVLAVGHAAAAEPRGVFLPTGEMNRARSGHTATLLQDGRVLIVGGWSEGNSNWTDSFAEIYEPLQGKFRKVFTHVDRIEGHSATLLADGRVLIAGGCCGFDRGNGGYLFDPQTEKFTRTGRMMATHYGHTATLLPDGRVLIAKGGWDPLDEGDLGPELYDPVSNTFSSAPEYAGRTLFSAEANLLHDGRVLITGANPAEIYDPDAGAFRIAGSMASNAYGNGMARHTATVLLNGTVLIAGGSEGPIDTCVGVRSAEIYEPSADSFREVGNMLRGRSRHTATRLRDGTVLMAGGGQLERHCVSIDWAELYDPRSESFVDAGAMTQPRAFHTATLLHDGTVLIAGGAMWPVRAAELYRPAPPSDPPPDEGSCVPDEFTACLLGRFQVQVRYRNAFDNQPVDAQARAKVTDGFADSNYETAFFYFHNPNNVEVMVKMLDQGNQINGVPTVAVITGIATPARVEVKVTDTGFWGTSRVYPSEFGSQAGKSDFTTFLK